MLVQTNSLGLQLRNAESADGLHHISRYIPEQASAGNWFLVLFFAQYGRAEHVNIHNRVETIKFARNAKKYIFTKEGVERSYKSLPFFVLLA